MADHEEHVAEEPSLIEKISEKFHHHDSSSSSDSEKSPKKRATPTVTSIPSPSSPPPAVITADAPPSVKSKIYRLFGRERPVHKVLGGGKPADIVLWRNKKISASVLGAATVIWILFECLEYHLLSLICHILIFALAILFLWSNATTFIHKSPPHIPDVQIPEKAVLEFANALRIEINQTLAVLREIASGKELKKFLGLIAGLWALSVVGSWFNFLTLFYILFVLLHTVPVLYEKYEDHVDAFGEKAATELKKYYAVLDERVLSKIPRGPLKDKKHA